jgi:hypothetical protein
MCKDLPKERKKVLFGKGKLTDSAVNYIQNCYGLAIRQNTGNIYHMVKNVSPILSHCSNIPDNAIRHKWCMRSDDSWCSYWNKDKQTKNKLNLPPNIKDEPEIKKLFDRLRDNSLLSKCLHGKTQNVNEALNGIIWTKCLKTVYVSRKTLEIGIYSAVIIFNEGIEGIKEVMRKAGMEIGNVQRKTNEKISFKRKRRLMLKSLPPVKRRRKDMRDIKRYKSDKNKETEEVTYKAGSF